METSTELVNRSGLLQQSEQHPPGNFTEEQRRALVMLITYTRALTRMSSGDAVFLATSAAAKETGLPINEVAAVLAPLVRETGAHYGPEFV